MGIKSLWLRLYTETLSDPKVQRLPDKVFKAWVNLLCVAKINDQDGRLPDSISDIAFMIHVSKAKAQLYMQVLTDAGLIEDNCMHEWRNRQYESDQDPTALDRKRKQRERDKSQNVTQMSRVTSRSKSQNVTRTDTESETDTESIKKERVPPDEAINLACLLFTLHRDQIDAKYSVGENNIAVWAADIERLHRIDGREWDEIEKAIRWIKAPGCFWAPNIMSGSKLREKFPAIVAQMQRPNGADKALKVNQRTAILDMSEA